jgi:hypothetical protein
MCDARTSNFTEATLSCYSSARPAGFLFFHYRRHESLLLVQHWDSLPNVLAHSGGRRGQVAQYV